MSKTVLVLEKKTALYVEVYFLALFTISFWETISTTNVFFVLYNFILVHDIAPFKTDQG